MYQPSEKKAKIFTRKNQRTRGIVLPGYGRETSRNTRRKNRSFRSPGEGDIGEKRERGDRAFLPVNARKKDFVEQRSIAFGPFKKNRAGESPIAQKGRAPSETPEETDHPNQ